MTVNNWQIYPFYSIKTEGNNSKENVPLLILIFEILHKLINKSLDIHQNQYAWRHLF